MSSPSWLSAGNVLRDHEGERWRITDVGVTRVELGHVDRGAHEVRREDLIEWVESGDWDA